MGEQSGRIYSTGDSVYHVAVITNGFCTCYMLNVRVRMSCYSSPVVDPDYLLWDVLHLT